MINNLHCFFFVSVVVVVVVIFQHRIDFDANENPMMFDCSMFVLLGSLTFIKQSFHKNREKQRERQRENLQAHRDYYSALFFDQTHQTQTHTYIPSK